MQRCAAVSGAMGVLLGIAVAILSLAYATQAAAESRVALVIGASAYRRVNPLANPANDAKLLAQSLRATGFDVTEVADPDFARFAQVLGAFRDKARRSDVALVYYAGHGVEVNGVNWLLPVNVVANSPEDLQFEAIRAAAVVDVVQEAHKIRLVILDACRNNPFGAKTAWSAKRGIGGRGLAREADSPNNVVIIMATKAGETAADGAGQANSPFAASLARLVREPSLRLASLPGRISRDVKARTGQDQSPDQQGIFDEPDWMFVPADSRLVPAVTSVAPAVSDIEQQQWDLCSRALTAVPCERYRGRFPKGHFFELAGDRIQDISATAGRAARIAAPPAVAARPELIPGLGIIVRRDSDENDAIRITTVQPGTSSQGKVFGGDLIVRINGEAIAADRTPGKLFADALAGRNVVRLTIRRGISEITAVLRL